MTEEMMKALAALSILANTAKTREESTTQEAVDIIRGKYGFEIQKIKACDMEPFS